MKMNTTSVVAEQERVRDKEQELWIWAMFSGPGYENSQHFYTVIILLIIFFIAFVWNLTVQLDPDEVAQMVIWVFQEDPIGAVGPEVEGDVSADARFKGGESHIGGLGNGYCIPDTPYKSKKQTLNSLHGMIKYATWANYFLMLCLALLMVPVMDTVR